MAEPRYIVTAAPGAPIKGIGFVRPGEAFTAPEGYIPSRTMLPLNKEAADALAKVKAELEAKAVEQTAIAKDDTRDQDERKQARLSARLYAADAAAVRLEVLARKVEAPKTETVLTNEELTELSGAGTKPPGEREPEKPQQGQRKPGRAADQ